MEPPDGDTIPMASEGVARCFLEVTTCPTAVTNRRLGPLSCSRPATPAPTSSSIADIFAVTAAPYTPVPLVADAPFDTLRRDSLLGPTVVKETGMRGARYCNSAESCDGDAASTDECPILASKAAGFDSVGRSAVCDGCILCPPQALEGTHCPPGETFVNAQHGGCAGGRGVVVCVCGLGDCMALERVRVLTRGMAHV
jgi:hypothetical protein